MGASLTYGPLTLLGPGYLGAWAILGPSDAHFVLTLNPEREICVNAEQ